MEKKKKGKNQKKSLEKHVVGKKKSNTQKSFVTVNVLCNALYNQKVFFCFCCCESQKETGYKTKW